jgi:DnaK suppressor protein
MAAAKHAPAKAGPAKHAPAKAGPTKHATVRPEVRAPAVRVPALSDSFLAEQRELLLEERQSYVDQAERLKLEAETLALEHEPGDTQFDEEGGEGGTANIDRELDLALSARALAAIDEIDRAMAKIANKTYGVCEQCGQPIPQARLRALPYAALCVACKSGGLSRRV